MRGKAHPVFSPTVSYAYSHKPFTLFKPFNCCYCFSVKNWSATGLKLRIFSCTPLHTHKTVIGRRFCQLSQIPPFCFARFFHSSLVALRIWPNWHSARGMSDTWRPKIGNICVTKMWKKIILKNKKRCCHQCYQSEISRKMTAHSLISHISRGLTEVQDSRPEWEYSNFKSYKSC